jgi:hypothetical protein
MGCRGDMTDSSNALLSMAPSSAYDKFKLSQEHGQEEWIHLIECSTLILADHILSIYHYVTWDLQLTLRSEKWSAMVMYLYIPVFVLSGPLLITVDVIMQMHVYQPKVLLQSTYVLST